VLYAIRTQVLRVFYDRLVDDADRLWMGGALSGVVEKHFKERFGKVRCLAATREPLD
jgi:dynein heavy chain